MPNLDAVSVGQLAGRLGLVSPDQLQDAQNDFSGEKSEGEDFLRHLERKGMLTRWQSNKIVKGDTDGFFLGGYKILYKIASGSFGRVYRAEDPGSGTIVAVKVLRARWTEDKRSIEMFEREGKVGMTLKHPGIVEVLAFKCDAKSNQYYIVMEFVEGQNLREFLQAREKIEPEEALRLIGETAEGLAHAYSRGVTHRDVKLTNILISTTGQAKLVDFGLATLNQNIHKEMTAQKDRTVDYAGLEKATNVPQGDTRSDIYFLGTVLYEMLSGVSPLEKSKNPNERMRSYRFTNVKPLSSLNVEAPPSVFQLVDNMMSLDPKRRFQTPSQLTAAIRAIHQELTGKTIDKKAVTQEKSVFIVESDMRLQDALRERFKEQGYRVFISNDPARCLDRFRQQPYSSLIMDIGTVGEDGIYAFDRVLEEAKKNNRVCAGVVILSEHQKDWVKKVKPTPFAKVLVRPVTLKQLQKNLEHIHQKHAE